MSVRADAAGNKTGTSARTPRRWPSSWPTAPSPVSRAGKRGTAATRTEPKRWIVGRYFGKFNKFRNDRWVFGDRASGACLVKFSWTGIVRHVPVKGTASPDDPALAAYWAERRQRVKPPLDRYTLRLLARQDGRCPLCGDHLLTADQPPQSPKQWEWWWLQVTRRR